MSSVQVARYGGDVVGRRDSALSAYRQARHQCSYARRPQGQGSGRRNRSIARTVPHPDRTAPCRRVRHHSERHQPRLHENTKASHKARPSLGTIVRSAATRPLIVEALVQFHAERSTGNVLPARVLSKKGSDPIKSRPEVGQAVTPEETTPACKACDGSELVTKAGKIHSHSMDRRTRKSGPWKSRLHRWFRLFG